MTVRKMTTREATHIAAAALLAVRKEARKFNMKPAALAAKFLKAKLDLKGNFAPHVEQLAYLLLYYSH